MVSGVDHHPTPIVVERGSDPPTFMVSQLPRPSHTTLPRSQVNPNKPTFLNVFFCLFWGSGPAEFAPNSFQQTQRLQPSFDLLAGVQSNLVLCTFM